MQPKGGVQPELKVYLLGPSRVVVRGEVVDEGRWTRRKAKALVQLLALRPHRRLNREQAMELLFPDLDPEQAARNMHRLVHIARYALEPDLASGIHSNFIHISKGQILLDSPGELYVDVEEFERRAAAAFKTRDAAAYEGALSVYAGDLLVEDLYEDWAAARREQVSTLRRELLVKLGEVYELDGRLAESVECFRKLTALDPADEELHRQLMRLHALSGNRRAALNQFNVCAEALKSELGVAPEDATEQLRRQIESGKLVGAGTTGRAASSSSSAPRFQQLAFRRGTVHEARFAGEAGQVVCAASWEGGPAELYAAEADKKDWRALGIGGVCLYSVSRGGEVASASTGASCAVT